MDEWLIFINSEATLIFLKGRIIEFPVWGAGALLIFIWQMVIHRCIALGCFWVSESFCQVKLFLRWKTWLGCFSFQLRWLTGSVAIRNGDVGSLEVDAIIHPCIHLCEHMVVDATVSRPLDKLRNRYCSCRHPIGWMCLPVYLIIPRAELSMLYWLLQQLLQPQGN